VRTPRPPRLNNFIGLKEQIVVADQDLSKGDCVVDVSFEMASVDKANMKTSGTAKVFIDDQQAAEQDIETQLGGFSVAGEGFKVGRFAGAPVTEDFPGDHPWAFSGGTIKRLIIDLSGEAYVDLEVEAAAAMKRD